MSNRQRPASALSRLQNQVRRYQGFAVSAGFRGLGAVSTLVVYRVGASFFSPSELAPLYFSITLSAILTPLLMLGLNTYSVKRLPTIDDEREAAGFMESVFGRYLSVALLAVIAVGGGLAIGSLFKPELTRFAILAPALLLFLPASSLLGSFFQGRSKYNISIFMLNICNNATLAVLLLILGLAPEHHRFAGLLPIAMIFSSVITIAICVALAVRLLKVSPSRFFRRTPGGAQLHAHRGEVFRFWTVLVLMNLSLWTPLVALYIVGPREQYTYASVAERLGNAINFFLIISNFFLAPVVARHYPRGEISEMSNRLSQITRLTALCAAPVALVVIFLPHLVLSLFGDNYSKGALFLSIMGLAQFYAVVMGSKNILLNMSGHERDLLWTIGVAFAVELVAMAVLGPTLGAIGFIIAYAVNLACQNTLAGVAVKRRIGIPFWHIMPDRKAADSASAAEPARSHT